MRFNFDSSIACHCKKESACLVLMVIVILLRYFKKTKYKICAKISAMYRTWFYQYDLFLYFFFYTRLKIKCQIIHFFKRTDSLMVDLWKGLYGQFQKKIFKVNFVDVISAYFWLILAYYILAIMILAHNWESITWSCR